jgi:hypothetical protein
MLGIVRCDDNRNHANLLTRRTHADKRSAAAKDGQNLILRCFVLYLFSRLR